jgi:hypothetical protein
MYPRNTEYRPKLPLALHCFKQKAFWRTAPHLVHLLS